MSLYTYQVFEIVSEQGSFAQAAKILNVTPSAVSHIISKLEQEFGVQLFKRDRNGITLTDPGLKLMPHISCMLRYNELLMQEVARIHEIANGTVRIGVFNSVAVHWLPRIINSFRSEYPDIEIVVFQGGYNEILHWISSNMIDLAFITDRIAPNTDYIPLHKDMVVCVTPKDYPLQCNDYVTIEEIKGMRLILQTDGYDAEVKTVLSKYKMNISSSIYVNSDESLIAMIAAGFGCCIMPHLASISTRSEVKRTPIVPHEYRIIGLMTINPFAVSPATKKMRQQILRFVEENDLMNI